MTRHLDRDSLDLLMIGRHMLREREAAGATPEEIAQVLKGIESAGLSFDDLTPEIEAQARTNTYRGPRCLILDGIGYDRDLAKASVDHGWHGLIDEIWDFKEREFPPGAIVVHQVKPKWTGLRVYFEASDEGVRRRFEAFTMAVRDRSYTICEECGAEGALPRREPFPAWIRTVCDEHAPPGSEAWPGSFREEPVTPESLAADIAQAEANRERAERERDQGQRPPEHRARDGA